MYYCIRRGDEIKEIKVLPAQKAEIVLFMCILKEPEDERNQGSLFHLNMITS